MRCCCGCKVQQLPASSRRSTPLKPGIHTLAPSSALNCASAAAAAAVAPRRGCRAATGRSRNLRLAAAASLSASLQPTPQQQPQSHAAAAAAVQSHASIPVPLLQAPNQQQQQQQQQVGRQGARKRQPAAPEATVQVAPSRLRPQQLVQLQQLLLCDQQQQQQQTGALGPTAAGAAAAVLLAGVAAGAGYVWKHKQQPSAVAGGATTQQQQQQQQQQQAWLDLPQVQQQLSAALTASVSRLQSSAAASAAAAAAAAAVPWQQLLAHIPGMRQAGTYTGTASAADTVAAAAVDTLQQSTGSRALRVGQQRQQQQQLVGPQQPKGWWQTLDQVHYLNFGSRAGLLPRVDLPQQQQQQQRRQGLAGDAAGSLPAAAAAAAAVEDGADVVTKQFLVAFQSKADAEYVCGVLQATLTATAVMSGKSAESAKTLFRCSVLQSKPWFLEDLAGVQRKGLEVLPQGLLDHSKPLTGPELEVLLVQYFSGGTPQQQQQQVGDASPDGTKQEQQQQQQQAQSVLQDALSDVADGNPAEASAPTEADISSSSRVEQQQQQQQQQQQRSSQTGFRPVSTDLLMFDLESATAGGGSLLSQPSESTESALRDVMAAGSAAVPVSVKPASSSSSSSRRDSSDSSSEKLSTNSSSSSSSGVRSASTEAAAAAPADDALSAPPVNAGAGFDASRRQVQAAAVVELTAAEADMAAAQVAASTDTDASQLQQSQDDAGYEEYFEDTELDADALMSEYQQLKQQHQSSGLQDFEAAYQRLQAEGLANGQPILQDISPTAIAAAAAEAGVGVDDGELADAVAAKFFAGPRAAVPTGSTARTAKPGSSTVRTARGAGTGSTAGGNRPVQQQQRQSDVLSSMQLQLLQLQEQAQAVLQQQQQQPGVVGNTTDSQLQSIMQGMEQLQQQIQQVSAATPLQPAQAADAAASSRRIQQQRYPPGVVEAEVVEPPGASKAASGSSSNSSSSNSIRNAAAVPTSTPSSSSSSGRGDAGPSSSGGASSSGGSSSRSSGSSGSSGSSSSNIGSNGSSNGSAGRSWGKWRSNARIKAANVSLLSNPAAATAEAAPAKPQQQQRGPSVASSSSSSTVSSTPKPPPPPVEAAAAAAAAAAQEDVSLETGDGATIVSAKLGVKRPKKVKRDPVERQNMVTDALRIATEGEAVPGYKANSSSSSSGQKPWWQEQFQAVFLPSIRHADGSVGFVQMDVSINPEEKDVRVLSFEDRHDCMKCLTVLRQWPEMAAAELSMGAVPSNVVEQEIRDSYLRMVAAAGGDPAAVGASGPANVVVFRRGKLPLRVGMSQDEFSQAVVWQAAAQLALSNIGYRFDDE